MDTWNRLRAVEGRRERDWKKEGEGSSQRTYICVTHGHRLQCDDGLREGGVGTVWRWETGGEVGTIVIV